MKKSKASEAASAMAKRRWRKATPEERAESGRRAVNARWAKYRAAKAAQETDLEKSA